MTRFGGATKTARNKAITAVAHARILIIWHVLTEGVPYTELGADFYTRHIDPQREALPLSSVAQRVPDVGSKASVPSRRARSGPVRPLGAGCAGGLASAGSGSAAALAGPASISARSVSANSGAAGRGERSRAPGTQRDALEAVGCDPVFTDKASGKLASRPELDKELMVAREGTNSW